MNKRVYSLVMPEEQEKRRPEPGEPEQVFGPTEPEVESSPGQIPGISRRTAVTGLRNSGHCKGVRMSLVARSRCTVLKAVRGAGGRFTQLPT